MLDIITIGSATRDVFLLSDQFEIVASKKSATGAFECVPLGSKVEVDHIVHTTGGGATNAAATFASLGFRTACVCRVGDDDAGGDILHELSVLGIKTSLVRRIPHADTAFSVLLTTASGERTALVYRGASATFSATDLPLSKMRAKWFYLTSLGNNLTVPKIILERSATHKTRIAWNPGNGEVAKGLRALMRLRPLADILLLNREEAYALTKTNDIKAMSRALHADGMITIITDGARGSYAYRDGLLLRASTTGTRSISRTGAGDAFGSALTAAHMKGYDLHDALAIATLNAESVIGHVGAKKGILSSWPTEAKMKKVKITRAA